MSVCIMCGTNLSGDEQCGTCPQCSESILFLWWGVLMGILLAFIFFVGMPDTIEEEVKKELEERRAKDQE
jgi:hypothetical protein